MNQMRLFIKSIGYSVQLMYASSKFLMVMYLGLSMVSATFPLVGVYILKTIIDELMVVSPNLSTILMYILFYIGTLVLKQVFVSFVSISEHTLFEKAGHKYETDLMIKLAKLPMSVIDTSEGKDLIQEVRYTKYTAIYIVYRLVQVMTLFYSFSIAFTMLIAFNIWFSLLFIALAIPGIISKVIFDKKGEVLRRKMESHDRKFSYYRWMLTDGWPAKDVKMYDLTDVIKERYNTEKKLYLDANKDLDKKGLKSSLVAELIKRSGEILFTIVVVLQAIDGKITIGEVALYIGYALMAIDSFQNMTTTFVIGYERTIEGMGYLFELMKIKCSDENKGVRQLEPFDSITFDKVYFKYPLTEKYVLEGVSFTLNKGDKLSIIGINGAGKSTIIKLMLGLYEIESGQILINGHPLWEYDIEHVRKMFSVLFQNFVQYPLSLKDNIVLSDLERKDKDEEIIEALKQSGIYDNYNKFENGLDSCMTRQFDDKGVELSKGQWQKIALARAYFKKASIIIFDEPSAALDAEAEDRIFKNFEAIAYNKTGIMISHRISSAKMSNKIIVLDGGEIVEEGTHDELVALDGLYAKLYNLQMHKYTLKEAK